jgi:hypothetical protein
MINNIRSAIGGLALLATTALPSFGNTNDVSDASFASVGGYDFKPQVTGITPEMSGLSFASSRYSNGKKVIVAATNLQSSEIMNNYQFERSTNLVDWANVGQSISPQSSPTNLVSIAVDMRNTDPYYNNSFFRIHGFEKN